MGITIAHPAVAVPTSEPITEQSPGPRVRRRNSGLGDVLFFNVTRVFAVFTLLTLVGIMISLLIASW
ncbi:MAG: hypothetical protein ACXWI9_16545, partial [Burkholderiales bacterium]